MTLSRDDARAAFLASGVSVGELVRDDILALRAHLTREFRQRGSMAGALKLEGPTRKSETANGNVTRIFVKSSYFNGREAFTINPDGFIGIAGWADKANARPFINALIAWSHELGLRKCAEQARAAQEISLNEALPDMEF